MRFWLCIAILLLCVPVWGKQEQVVTTSVPLVVHYYVVTTGGSSSPEIAVAEAPAQIWRTRADMAVNSDSHLDVAQYEIRFSNVLGVPKRIFLSDDEAGEIRTTFEEFADTSTQYNVWRTTSGYSAGEPLELHLYLALGGGLERQTRDGSSNLVIVVKYRLCDAERELISVGPGAGQMDPHGRIVFDDRGRVRFVAYTKEVNVRGNNFRGLPMVNGEAPSVEDAIRLAQDGNDASRLRFAADFGPQKFNGSVNGGDHQLVPIIPIGTVEHHGKKLVVFLPPDRLQDYNRGRLGPDQLMVIPQEAVRFVPDASIWAEILDDYFELRQRERLEQIFVANRKNAVMGPNADTFAVSATNILQNVSLVRGQIERKLADSFLGIVPEVHRQKKLAGQSGGLISVCLRSLGWLLGRRQR